MKISSKVCALALGASFVVLSACSNDPAGPGNNVNVNVIVNQTNSYYIYDRRETDSSGSTVNETQRRDSTVVTGRETVAGKDATRYETYHDQGRDTNYYYQDGNRLYSYTSITSKLKLPPFVSTVIPGKSWFEIANFTSGSTWTLFDSTVSNVEVPFLGAVTGRVLVTGRQNGDTTMVINGKTYTAIKIATTFRFEPQGSALLSPMSSSYYEYYINGVGLAMFRRDYLNYLGLYRAEGEVKTLNSFSIR